jgi:hypothetical protein
LRLTRHSRNTRLRSAPLRLATSDSQRCMRVGTWPLGLVPLCGVATVCARAGPPSKATQATTHHRPTKDTTRTANSQNVTIFNRMGNIPSFSGLCGNSSTHRVSFALQLQLLPI